jgi:hypothetical protein
VTRNMSLPVPGMALLGVLAAVAVLMVGLTPAALASSQPAGAQAGPAAGPSLSGWRLILPVNSSGGTSGNDAAELNPAKLDSPWLTRKSNGDLDFWAPAIGATTPGSLHARTELVSNDPFVLGQGPARTLKETLEVTKQPSQSKNIIIGQLFEQNNTSSTSPYAMWHYEAGEIYVFVTGVSGDHVLLSGIPLSRMFSTTVTASGNDLTFSASCNGKTAHYTITNTAGFPGNDVEWHAGDYEQDVSQGASRSDGGRVVFSTIKTSQG